jgi:ribosomal protein S18 acetylase RimI-like enzyme
MTPLHPPEARRPPSPPTRFSCSLDVRVRRCTEADLSALEWFGLFTPHRELIRVAYERQLAGEVEMLLGDVADFPVAQLWIDRVKRRDERVGVLWAIRVFPFLRRLGIGTALLSEAEAWLREQGFLEAELGVEKDNADARRLYERRGYRHVGEACEAYSYTAQDGSRVEAIADQWLLRKPL